MNPAESNTGGQILALVVLVAFLATWVAVAVRREKVRDRQRLRRLAKVSGVQGKVGHTTKDRSGT